MSDDWDADDFEPAAPIVPKEAVKGQWDDEDKEEETVKESWEDEGSQTATKAKAEKKEKKAKVEVKPKEAAVADEVLTDPLAEKMRQQRLVEESDFKLMKEMIGGKSEELKSLDDFIPKTEAEFLQYSELVAGKLTAFNKSFHYMAMVKAFVRKATVSLTAAETKDLNLAMGVILNDKLKAEKEAEKGKKKAVTKKSAAKLKVDKADDFDGDSGYSNAQDDYDFM
eukprot:TRINITY_DN29578_c0_g1_i1.p1 TRINITY_DN29578_c0_g1~~TRINITY_DN29578_c0_g1_i1.p1  ORF type:complete len:225 (+),score=81.45 TRINITY_DN29578_c0_g1_i1:326-1000(+)